MFKKLRNQVKRLDDLANDRVIVYPDKVLFRVKELKEQGWTERAIARSFGMDTWEYRAWMYICRQKVKAVEGV